MIRRLQKKSTWVTGVFLLMLSVSGFGQTSYYSKASATDFNDVNSWGTATDGTGTSPASISNADNFIIQNSSVMSLTSNANVRFLTINAGSLTIASNTLTVSIQSQNNATLTLNSGSNLTVSGGTLDINGNFIIATGGTFNQSGGNVNVDGNSGTAGTSVASATVMVSWTIATAANLSLTGGTFTIVDPHISTANTFQVSYTPVGAVSAGLLHTFRFGDGISTTNGGTNGFKYYSWAGSGIFKFGNVIIEPVTAGTNRHVLVDGTYYNFAVTGNLTIGQGAELRSITSSMIILAGDLTINTGGTLTSASTVHFANVVTSSITALAYSPTANPQTITNSGTIRNLVTSPTANLTSLTVNNSSISGVTINTPLTVSGTLTLTAGILNTNAVNTLRLGTATAAGTLSGGSATAYINGPFLRTFASSRSATGTYTVATLFPVGNAGQYMPVWVDPSTNSGGAAIMSAEAFATNSGSIASGYSNLSGVHWEVSPKTGAANFTGTYLQLGNGTNITSAKKILQSGSATGIYSPITPLTSYTTGTPNTIRTTGSQITAASFTGFFAYGEAACAELSIGKTIVTGSSSAIVRWNTPTTSPAGGYEIFVSQTNGTPGTPNHFSSIDTFVALNTLNPATKYYAWVRSNCGGVGISAWSLVDSFVTECVALTAINENFASAAMPALPVCWAKVGTTGTVNTQNTNTNSAPNCLYMYGTSATDVAVVALPPVSNAGAGTHWLRLNARANVTLNGVIQVGYLTTPGNAASFVPVQSFTAHSFTYQPYTIDLGLAPGTNTVIALRNPGVPANSILIDDVIWEQKPSCMTPAIGTSIVSGSTDARIRWTAPLPIPSSGYEIFLNTTNTAPGSSTTPTHYSPSDTFADVYGLTPATKHYVWVRSACIGSDRSTWSAIDSFTTQCALASGIIENFGSVTAPALPVCWSKVGTAGSASTQIADALSAPNCLYMYSSSTSNLAVVALPAVNNAGAGTHWLRLQARGNSAANGVIQVGYLTTPGNAASFVAVQSFSPSSLTYQQYTIDLGTTPGANTVIALRHSGSPANSVLIDDINWELKPTCYFPLIGKSIVTGTSSATVRWTAPSPAPASGYEIFVSTSRTAPVSGSTPTHYSYVDTFLSVGSLAHSTTHYVWVRSSCNASDKSMWSAIDSFVTECGPISSFPWNENFDGMSAVGAGIVPMCWKAVAGTKAWTSMNTGSTTYNSPKSAPNYVTIAYGNTNASNLWTPGFQLTANVSYDFSFYYHTNGTTASYIGYTGKVFVNSVTDLAGAIQLDTFIKATQGTTSHTLYKISYTPSTTGTYHFALNVSSTGVPWYLGVDDFRLIESPLCADVTGVTVRDITTSMATLAWNKLNPAPVSGYDYYYNTTGVAPQSSTLANGGSIDTSTILMPLAQATTYYVWLRSNCGGIYGNWSATPYTFTTPVNSLPYAQDFEAGNAGWTSAIVSGTANDWILGTPAKTVINGAHSGTKAWVTKLTGNYSLDHDAALVSPVLDFTNYTNTPVLRFYHKFYVESGYDATVVEISINSGPWTKLDAVAGTGTNFNTANSYSWYNSTSTNGGIAPPKFSGNTSASLHSSANNGWIQSATYLTGAAGQSNVRIRFRLYGDDLYSYEGWAIDDIQVLDITTPSGGSTFNSVIPANTSAAITLNKGTGQRRLVVARLASTPAVAPTDWTLYTANSLFGSGTTTGTGNFVVYSDTGSAVNVTGLTLNTNYTFDVYEYNGKYMHAKFTAAASSNATTTPVKLVAFTAANRNGNGLVSWQTASEVNNIGFNIERSVDGKNFEYVDFVKGAGNSNVLNSYNFTDKDVFNRTNAAKVFYRLKQLDNDGKFEYSRIASITNEEATQFVVNAYPVPFKNNLSLSVESITEANATLTIIDLQGRVITTKTVSLNGGNNVISINELNSANAGVYFIKVNNGTETKTVRAVKVD